MTNWFKKILEFIGLSDAEDNLDVEPMKEARESRETKESNDSISFHSKKSKIVNIHTTAQLKVVVHTPVSYENAREISDHLKAKKPVVINLENLDTPVAKRIIDFLSGAVYSLDGNIQKIADRIFLITPYNVGIMSGDIRDELKSKMIFPSARER